MSIMHTEMDLELFEEYAEYEDTARIQKIPRSKRTARALEKAKPRHFIDKSFPKWAYDGRLDPMLKLVIAEFVKVDPHIEEVAKEQNLEIIEAQAETEGYY